MKINFVCHGNICRSPMAEFVFKDMLNKEGINNISVSSSATSYEEIGNDTHYGTKRVLDKYNIPYTKRKAVHFEKSDYKNFDLIIVMDKNNIRNLLRIIGSDKDNKVHMLLEYGNNIRDISDPWYTGNFEKTYDDIVEGCTGLLNYIKSNNML